MARNSWIGLALMMTAATAMAQQRQARIEVKHYRIEAEVDPRMRTLSAKVLVEFVPQDEYTTSADFELNNALNSLRCRMKPAPGLRYALVAELLGERELRPAAGKGQTGQPGFRIQRRLTGRKTLRVRIKLPRSSRLRLPAVSGAVVSGGRLQHQPAHDGHAHHSAFALQGDRSWNRAPGDAGRRQVAYSFQFTQPAFPAAWRLCRATRCKPPPRA